MRPRTASPYCRTTDLELGHRSSFEELDMWDLEVVGTKDTGGNGR